MSARNMPGRWRRWRAGRAVTLAGSESPAGPRSSGAPLAPTDDRPDPATDGELAVLVLEVSWALGDAAHDLPAGRVSAQRREELADTLQALGFIVRASAPGTPSGPGKNPRQLRVPRHDGRRR